MNDTATQQIMALRLWDEYSLGGTFDVPVESIEECQEYRGCNGVISDRLFLKFKQPVTFYGRHILTKNPIMWEKNSAIVTLKSDEERDFLFSIANKNRNRETK